MLEKIMQLTELKRIVPALTQGADPMFPGHFVVTSSLAGEGKSLVASGVAVQMASNSSSRVLLVDFNWRSPVLHRHFGRDQDFDYQKLQGSSNPMNLVQKTDYKELDLLPAPRTEKNDRFPDGQELCVDILKRAREQYQNVIVDTGPLFPENRFMLDPLRLGQSAIGTLLVYLAGVTPRSIAKKSVAMFREHDIGLTGVLMNDYQNPLAGRV